MNGKFKIMGMLLGRNAGMGEMQLTWIELRINH